ncbi:DUF3574 domain-containing protein [Novosphingobium sp. EMRT-2]|uniref:DUF3574 domain-containing protein n=1 Tax=Novosphingobium sp. EMRT-2 TaxID=2571749 RepID=UPI0010BD34F1|nr:DUF3574 domain-containing protein [Novosphingobium sp. EMRT-2]QCI92379.1 DUF3574 domain-containing protein [Novosphingobium sp. EMRT-2]
MTPRRRTFQRWAIITVALAGLLAAPLPLLPDRIVRTSAVIDRSPETVFAYVTTPANWPRWHPSSLRVEGKIDRPGQVGDRVGEDFRVAGVQGHAVWRVTERVAPWRWSISGVTGHSGRGTVTYHLRRIAGTTEFVREFRYRRPSLLFALLDSAWLNRRIVAESETATSNLKRNLQALPDSAALPSEQVRTELYFGRSVRDGPPVSVLDWRRFIAREVSPRFPAGLTVVDASGQFRDREGGVSEEGTFLLIIIHPAGPASERHLTAIRTAYKRWFRQEAVLQSDSPVSVIS